MDNEKLLEEMVPESDESMDAAQLAAALDVAERALDKIVPRSVRAGFVVAVFSEAGYSIYKRGPTDLMELVASKILTQLAEETALLYATKPGDAHDH